MSREVDGYSVPNPDQPWELGPVCQAYIVGNFAELPGWMKSLLENVAIKQAMRPANYPARACP